MAYTDTTIAKVATPAAAPLPAIKTYQTPTVATVKPTLNTANTGYKAPVNTSFVAKGLAAANTGYKAPVNTSFVARNVNAGLLEYDPNTNLAFNGREINAAKYDATASTNLAFNGREINAAAANINQATPDFKAANNYLTDGAFVENRMNGLLEDPNSLTMQRAKAQGMADAGSRGLQNTTMGATIGQSVMADKALQIATPDAATQAQGDLSRQGATYAAQQANRDAANQGSLAQQTAKINSALSAQQAGQGWDSKKLDGVIQGSLAEQETKNNSALSAQAAGHGWDGQAQKSELQGALNTQNANIVGAQTTQGAQYAADSRTQTGHLEGAAAQQNANISGELATQQAQYDTQARAQQGLLEGAATQQKAAISGELAGMESVSAQNLTILQNKLESAGRTTQDQNAAIMQQYAAQQDMIKTTVNNEYQKAAQQAQLNAAQRDSLSSAMSTMANNYEISIQNIMLDPNLDATSKNTAIIRINKIFNQDMANISAVFGASYASTTT